MDQPVLRLQKSIDERYDSLIKTRERVICLQVQMEPPLGQAPHFLTHYHLGEQWMSRQLLYKLGYIFPLGVGWCRGVSRGGVIGVRWPPHKNFSWPPQSEVWTKFQKMFACGAFIGWLDTPLGWCGGGGGVRCKLTASQLTQPPHKLSNLARPFIIKSYILTLWGRRRESVF